MWGKKHNLVEFLAGPPTLFWVPETNLKQTGFVSLQLSFCICQGENQRG